MPFNFITASILAEAAQANTPDRILMFHNHFRSMIAYEGMEVPVYTKAAVGGLLQQVASATAQKF